MILLVMEVDCASVRLSVRLNDVEVFRESQASSRLTQIKIGQFAVWGENRLSVSFEPVWSPRALADAGRPRFEVEIVGGEWGRLPTQADLLLSLGWPQPLAPPDNEQEVFEFERSFVLEEAIPRWSWLDATSHELTDGTRAGILEAVRRLHTALDAADTPTVLRLLEVKLEELALALDLETAELLSDQAEQLNRLFSAPNWRMEPLLEDALSIQSYAEGKLFQVETASGEAPLRGESDAGQLALPIMLSDIGTWTVVR